MRDASSAGGPHEPRMRASFSMRSSRLSMTGGRRIVAGSCITATEAAQYLSIKYTERLAEAGIEPSVGSVGDSYDNALAETINGLYKAEVIHRRGPASSSAADLRGISSIKVLRLREIDLLEAVLLPRKLKPGPAHSILHVSTEQALAR